MNAFSRLCTVLVGSSVLFPVLTWANPAGTAFTYQGQLKEDGSSVNDVCDFEFALFDASTNGTEVGTTGVSGVEVDDGLFAAQLDFGTSPFDGGEARFLEVSVQCTDDVAWTTLSPRQELTPVPYALRALSGGSGDGHSLDAVDGNPIDVVFVDANGRVGIGTTSPTAALHLIEPSNLASGQAINIEGVQPGVNPNIRFTEDGGDFTNIRLNESNGNAMELATGSNVRVTIEQDGDVGIGTTSPTSKLHVAGDIAASGVIKSGNSITIDGDNHLIDSDGDIEMHVSTGRALRMAVSTSASFAAPNIIGGYRDNEIVSDVQGGTICGGGAGSGLENRVTDHLAFVGGGIGNVAGDDDLDLNSAQDAVVVGGQQNTASGHTSAVGGGLANLASGRGSAIPGGSNNIAAGRWSFAAGYHAEALHDSTFVWADIGTTPFQSTVESQFLIKAINGTGINTNTPDSIFHVLDTEDHGGIITQTADNALHNGLYFRNSGSNYSWGIYREDAGSNDADLVFAGGVSNANPALLDERMRIDRDGNVGIATSSPQASLHVADASNNVRLLVDGGTALIPAEITRSGDGLLVAFIRNGATAGSISVAGATVSYNAFTGGHYAWTDEHIEAGTLVSLTGVNRPTNPDQPSEPQYGIAASTVANDSRCAGAYLGVSQPGQPAAQSNPHLIAAVGNGDMWVVDTGRNLQPGDYLIASDVKGHAMLDDPARFAVGYVVARVAEPVDWAQISDTLDGRKHRKISVFFENFVRGSHAVADMQRELAQLRGELARQATSMAAIETHLARLDRAQTTALARSENRREELGQ